MLRYYNYLTKQFLEAKGLRKADFSSETFVSEWGSWLDKLGLDVKKYYEFLKETGYLPSDHKQIVEIGKSSLDSLTIVDDFSVITPYTLGIESTGSSIIKAEFKVLKSKPFMVQKDVKRSMQVSSVSSKVKTFMTQNPYSFKKMDHWEELPNIGKRDILVGVYGKTYDKDREQKIRQLEELKTRLSVVYKEAYTSSGDTYCYAIKSDSRCKRK